MQRHAVVLHALHRRREGHPGLQRGWGEPPLQLGQAERELDPGPLLLRQADHLAPHELADREGPREVRRLRRPLRPRLLQQPRRDVRGLLGRHVPLEPVRQGHREPLRADRHDAPQQPAPHLQAAELEQRDEPAPRLPVRPPFPARAAAGPSAPRARCVTGRGGLEGRAGREGGRRGRGGGPAAAGGGSHLRFPAAGSSRPRRSRVRASSSEPPPASGPPSGTSAPARRLPPARRPCPRGKLASSAIADDLPGGASRHFCLAEGLPVECFRRVKTGGEGRAWGAEIWGKARSPGWNAS